MGSLTSFSCRDVSVCGGDEQEWRDRWHWGHGKWVDEEDVEGDGR